MCERERVGEVREGSERERERVCVCVCVRARARWNRMGRRGLSFALDYHQ